ncbi:MAG: DUF167 domain-containing protein [Candidatus Lambdaproteobacteria bacterium]|nr:DUF167 domain-containing protein [Candidatus Lambdaproteobacteria bacterium]
MAKSERAYTAPARYRDGTVTLTLHLRPNARRTEWAGPHGPDALGLRVAAPPSEGRANAACLRFLAAAFGVPPSAVTLLAGAGSREKRVEIGGVSPERYREVLAAWLGAEPA